MSEEKKKGGFWASLFGRNKKQEEQKLPQTSWKNAWERIWKKGAKKL